jgi:hypothetical protein
LDASPRVARSVAHLSLKNIMRRVIFGFEAPT